MTYEYICTACGNAWEAEQSISSPPLKTCPSCGKAEARRQISGGAGFILKGGGWYADGYGSAKPGSAKEKEGAASAAPVTDAKADAKKDAKPDAAAASTPPKATPAESTPKAESNTKTSTNNTPATSA